MDWIWWVVCWSHQWRRKKSRSNESNRSIRMIEREWNEYQTLLFSLVFAVIVTDTDTSDAFLLFTNNRHKRWTIKFEGRKKRRKRRSMIGSNFLKCNCITSIVFALDKSCMCVCVYVAEIKFIYLALARSLWRLRFRCDCRCWIGLHCESLELSLFSQLNVGKRWRLQTLLWQFEYE